MGVELFANWHDVEHVDRTVAKLRACGAMRVIAMVQAAIVSPRAARANAAAMARFIDAVDAVDGLAATLTTGPGVLASHDPLGCRDRLEDLCSQHACTPMLDAEPSGALHWSEPLLAPWLEIADLQITTTRMEAPRLGHHGRTVYAQLEGQTSTATLSQALAIHARCTDRERIVPVLGSFDQSGDPRTLDEVRTDLERCTDQARLCGRLAVWVAQTTSDAECALLREWGERAFGC